MNKEAKQIKMNLDDEFIQSFNYIADDVNQNSIKLGYGIIEKDREPEQIALMHSELSEALEAIRHGNPPSEHIPEFSGVEEELADEILRIMNFAKARGYRIPEALIAKAQFNKTRTYMHGGKKF